MHLPELLNLTNTYCFLYTKSFGPQNNPVEEVLFLSPFYR